MHLIGIHLLAGMRLIGMHLVGENIIVVGCEEFRFSKFGKRPLFCHYSPPYPCLAAAEVRIVVGLPRRCISPPDRKLELQLHRHFESRSTSLDSSSSYLLDLHRRSYALQLATSLWPSIEDQSIEVPQAHLRVLTSLWVIHPTTATSLSLERL